LYIVYTVRAVGLAKYTTVKKSPTINELWAISHCQLLAKLT